MQNLKLSLTELSSEAKEIIASNLDEIKKFKNKMETRNIKISLETATRWFNGCDKELKDLAVQTFPELEKKKLPKSWKALEKINGYWVESDSRINAVDNCITKPASKKLFATIEQAEASIALAQLSQLREVYRNGWKPDWTNYDSKYCIDFKNNEIKKEIYYNTSVFLSFQDKETSDLFLENFKDLILIAKHLMS